MNKLCINTDFQEFLKRIKNDLTINEIHKGQYDKVLSTEELIDKFKH
jgi:3-deoxy-D-manno-octulosonate 8-phosphate phosphatase KdsC-like HAD superfamily phosphatase